MMNHEQKRQQINHFQENNELAVVSHQNWDNDRAKIAKLLEGVSRYNTFQGWGPCKGEGTEMMGARRQRGQEGMTWGEMGVGETNEQEGSKKTRGITKKERAN